MYQYLLQVHLISAAPTLVQGSRVPYPAVPMDCPTTQLDLITSLGFSLHLVEVLVVVSTFRGGVSRAIAMHACYQQANKTFNFFDYFVA